eukprot:gene15802-19305_t
MGSRAAAEAERSLVQAANDIHETGLPCGHVLYENLVTDPVGVVRDLYSQLQLPFSAEHEAAISDYLEKNKEQREALKKSGKRVLHEYRPEDFGLDPAVFSQGKFADYVEKFGIASSI